jgi:ribosome biogenesis GTPase
LRTKSFAANLARLLVVVAGEPVFSEAQLARALIAAEDAGIPACVLLNKTDLPSIDAARVRLEPYRAMGYEVVETAIKAKPDEARATLAPLLAGRTSFVLGASGMGKSSLINLMVPAAAAQVGEISAALQAGRHTTTTTSWYWLDDRHEGALIDSPGFQEFGLMHIAPERLAELMPDLRRFLGACRFYNCTHQHEPGCDVRAAAERGDIAPSRLRVYESLREELAPRR